MSRLVECQTCGENFERQKGSNRLNCERCRPSRAVPDVPATVTPIRPAAPVDPDSYVPPPAPDGPHVPGRIETKALAELEQLNALDTLDGALAIGFAAALDDQWLPGAQRTSMTKQLQIIMDTLRASLPAEKDAIDAYAEAARRLREEAG